MLVPHPPAPRRKRRVERNLSQTRNVRKRIVTPRLLECAGPLALSGTVKAALAGLASP
jgi:uncharacterized membrane protein YqgA involved in biofilm formation